MDTEERCTRCGADPEIDGYYHTCVVDGRAFVDCDLACPAYDEPQTDAEYREAYEHWRRHSCLHGCSHGR